MDSDASGGKLYPHIVYEERPSAPASVRIAYARHRQELVTIGLVASQEPLEGGDIPPLPDNDVTPFAGALCRLDIASGAAEPDCVKAKWAQEWPKTQFVADPICNFLPFDLAELPLRLWMTGTAFQHQVWRVMLSIPPGRTMTYGEVAQRIGRPKASRAVGMACGANPVPLIVPCHRVVAAQGGLGGYSGRGGPAFKQSLLRRETEAENQAAGGKRQAAGIQVSEIGTANPMVEE